MGAPTSTPRRRRRIRWRTKHYFSVAMVGGLVAIALVAAISISLAPAHLTFSITHANIATYSPSVDNHNRSNTHLNFTLVVNNSSPRTAASYGAITGEISYGPAAAAWVRYHDPGQPGVWQKPLSSVLFNFSADYGYNETIPFAVDNSRIVMESKVRFSWRGLSTLPYIVHITCKPVNFVYNTGFPVICA